MRKNIQYPIALAAAAIFFFLTAPARTALAAMKVDAAQELKLSRNMLSNSSFEYCTLDGLPDYWGCPHWGIVDPYFAVNFEQWTKCFGTDTSMAFDGARSMRVDCPFDNPYPDRSALSLISVSAGTACGAQYVLSAYMKSRHPGMKVSMGGKELMLSTEWQRYSVSFTRQDQSLYADTVNIYPLSKGTYWIDAVQLEKGAEAAPYLPSFVDTVLLAESKGDKAGNQVPVCTLKEARGEIKVDGLLDEADWQSARKLNFRLVNGGEPVEPSYAKLTYNAKGIYIGVYCKDAAAATAQCMLTQRDSFLWFDPSIEIFLDPKLSKTSYYHLVFNKKGVQYDACGADESWNCSWKVTTHIGNGSWSAEAFLPFNEMGIDNKLGGRWGINICRENPSAGEGTCWSPTIGGFHTPQRFGEIQMDSRVLADYRIYVKDANAKPLSPSACSLSMTVANASGKDTHLLVRAVPDGGDEYTFERKLIVGGKSSKSLTLGNLKLQDATRKLWRFSVFTADGKNMLNSRQIWLNCPENAELIPQFTLYTSEKDMRIRLRLGFADQLINSSTATVSISRDGKELLERKLANLSRDNYITVPISEMQVGKYSLAAKVMDGGGKIIADLSQNFQKATPRKNEVKIDGISRVVTVNGKPFVPMGFNWEGPLPLELLDYIAKSGSNAVDLIFLDVEQPEKVLQVLDDAEKCGLKVKVGFQATDLDKAKKFMSVMKEHPALLAWGMFDEPFCTEWGKNNYQLLSDRFAALKDFDPYHPVYINDNEYGLSYLKSKNLSFPGDIISVDYYAYPPLGNIPITGDYAKQMYNMGKLGSKPCWMYAFASGYAFWASRDPSPQEQVCTTYLPFVNGITGLFYLASHPKSISQWNKIKDLMSEIKQLTPVIASPLDLPQGKCSSPSVQMLLKKYDGALYVIAVNSSREPVTVKLDVSSALATRRVSKVSVLFEGRSVGVRDGIINDKFAGFARHVYRLE